MNALWIVFVPVFIAMGVISALWIVRMARTAFCGTAKEEEKEEGENSKE